MLKSLAVFAFIAAATVISSIAPAPRAHFYSTVLTKEPATVALNRTAIPRIVCMGKPTADGIPEMIGTGVWIAKDTAITAAHVVRDSVACSIEGQRVLSIRRYEDLDFAVITAVNQGGVVAPISCEGIVPGREYRATGYAEGETYTRSAIWIGLAGKVDDPTFQMNGFSRFEGLGIGGMSGGPVTEASTGRVAAIVNAGHEEPPHDSWGRALADTYLCGAHHA